SVRTTSSVCPPSSRAFRVAQTEPVTVPISMFLPPSCRPAALGLLQNLPGQRGEYGARSGRSSLGLETPGLFSRDQAAPVRAAEEYHAPGLQLPLGRTESGLERPVFAGGQARGVQVHRNPL